MPLATCCEQLHIQTRGVQGGNLQRDLDGEKKPSKLNLSAKDLPFPFPQRNAFPRVIAEPCLLTLCRTLALLLLHDGARALGALPAVPAPALRPWEGCAGLDSTPNSSPHLKGRGRCLWLRPGSENLGQSTESIWVPLEGAD